MRPRRTFQTGDDIEEMEEAERERLERMLEAVTLAGDAEDVRKEVVELRDLAERAKSVEDSGSEEKLARLRFHPPRAGVLRTTLTSACWSSPSSRTPSTT